MSRQQITLVIDEFNGPGDYKTDVRSSNFVGVGLDTEKAKEAKDSDAKQTKVITDSIKKSNVILLSYAKVKVTAATYDAIDGTFEWTAPPHSKDPSLTDGKFHAVIRKKK